MLRYPTRCCAALVHPSYGGVTLLLRNELRRSCQEAGAPDAGGDATANVEFDLDPGEVINTTGERRFSFGTEGGTGGVGRQIRL